LQRSLSGAPAFAVVVAANLGGMTYKKVTLLRQTGDVCGESCICLSFCDISHSFPDVCVPVMILSGITGSGETAARMAR